MREVIVEGKEFSVRPLKRSEVKALKKDGLNLGKIPPEEMDLWLDRIFELVFPGMLSDIDDLPPRAASKLFEAVMKETYGDKDEEKN